MAKIGQGSILTTVRLQVLTYCAVLHQRIADERMQHSFLGTQYQLRLCNTTVALLVVQGSVR